MSTQQAVPKLDTPLVQDTIGTTHDGQTVVVKGAIISIPWYRFLISLWNRTGGNAGNLGAQTGTMYVWAGDPTQPPDGTLICDGRQVSRGQYSDLFAAIGVRWGAGDGATTFNIPDIQDRFVLGASATEPSGSIGGASALTLDVSQLPNFTPTVIDPGHAHGIVDPTHAHAQQVANNNVAGVAGTQGGTAANTTSVGTTDAAATGITVSAAVTGITIAPLGAGAPIDVRPNFIAAPWVIQT